jgi:hypothetical protein
MDVLYFCYGEKPTGVIRSQVVDVVRQLGEMGLDATLAVAVPARGREESGRAFHEVMPGALVMTAAPTRLQAWLVRAESLRIAMLLRSARPRTLICRNAFATDLVLRARELSGYRCTVCLDGRGALMAEQAEYNVHPAYSVPQVGKIEQRAVLLADARIAVTAGLVEYWRRRFGYASDRHVVIPTTLSSSWTTTCPDPAVRAAIRSRLGIAEDEIVLLYAGSNSPWQGIDLLLDEAERGLARSPRVKFLFLTDRTPRMDAIMRESGGRFIQQRVPPTEVRSWMQAADYGLLIRPPTETNEVAFPTKYAEYLSAGLKVISNGPPAVLEHLAHAGTGLRIHGQLPWEALRTGTPDDRQESYSVAVRDFSKSSYRSQYANLTSLLLG